MKIAITQGDINGVGLEMVLKTFAVPEMLEICTPVLYCAPKVLGYHRKILDLNIQFNVVPSAADAVEGKFNVVSINDGELPVMMGQATSEAGAAAAESLKRAAMELRDGLVNALVTAPVDKTTLQSEAFPFNSQSTFLATVLAPEKETEMINADEDVADGSDSTDESAETVDSASLKEVLINNDPLTILVNDQLRVALVTDHIPLSNVAASITKDNIMSKLKILDRSLRRDFGISRPRIAVLSLNPHGGSAGMMGTEELEIINPSIEESKQNGIHAYGPLASDTFFGQREYEHYDAVLAMYHDQGVGGFKALAMESGVNLTTGLSAVRTASCHGTCYEIAGKNHADEISLRNAIYVAVDVFRNREMYDEAHSNPMPKLYRERREDDRPFSRQPQMRV